MALRRSMSLIAVITALPMLAACSGGGNNQNGANLQGTDLNDPGSWAYQGCKQALLQRIRADHPQVETIDIVGHVTEEKDTDSRSVLSGEAKFLKGSDNFHLTFTCQVDRGRKQIIRAKYDKK